MSTKPQFVVDGANILYDDRGIVIREDGKRQPQIRPERLLSLINYIEENGGEVICLVKDGTYHSGRKKSSIDNPRFGDWSIVEKLIKSGKIQIVNGNDDIYVILYALEIDAFIISRDKFRDHKKSHQELDWKKIGQLKIEDYTFIKNKFVSPTTHSILNNKNAKMHSENKNTSKNVNIIKVEKSKNIIKSGSKSNKITDGSNNLVSLIADLHAVLNSLTSDDGQCNLSYINEQLARDFLGKEGAPGEWKSGWPIQLKKYVNDITGKNIRTSTWVKKNLPPEYKLQSDGTTILRDE